MTRWLISGLVAAALVVAAGCEDPCKSEDAALEVTVLLGQGVDEIGRAHV